MVGLGWPGKLREFETSVLFLEKYQYTQYSDHHFIFMLRIDTGLLGSISSPRPRLLVALSPLASSYVTITPINTAHLWQLPWGSASTTILGSIRSSLVSCKSLPATVCILTPKTCMETKKSSNCEARTITQVRKYAREDPDEG